MLAALEADLLTAGFTWDEMPHRVSWRAVLALFRHARRGSAVYEEQRRAAQGEYARYTQDTHLLTLLHDDLQALQHLYLSVHSKHPPKPPEPTPRPGVDAASRSEIKKTPMGISGDHVGSGAVTKEELARFWNDHAGWLASQGMN